jgi:general L-amino acid transport system substrate-binding protein
MNAFAYRRRWLALPAGTAVMLLAMLMPGVPDADAQTLAAVKQRGALICGVNEGLYGFSAADDKGGWKGFDVDLCRAIAAAIFDDPSKVQYVPLNVANRFPTLQSGKIDVLSRNSTWTLGREANFKINFAGVNYYDGQGFLVRRKKKVTSAYELGGSTICVTANTTSVLNVEDFFRANNIKYELHTSDTGDQTRGAYASGTCDVMTSDVSQLYAERLKLADADEHIILPDIISKEPLGPVVRFGDDQWLNIVKWTNFAMINAEELGIASKTIDTAMKSEKPAVKRFVGREGNFGELLGLSNDWAARIVRHIGNYGEVFERNVGIKSKLGIPRGINNLWSKGGIQYAPPIR